MFHTDIRAEGVSYSYYNYNYEYYYNNFVKWVSGFLTDEKKVRRFEQFLRNTPIPTNDLLQSIWSELSRIWQSANPYKEFNFKDESYSIDFKEYLEGTDFYSFIKNKAWNYSQTSPNSFIYIDLATNQTTPRPEPLPYLLDICHVYDYRTNDKEVEYLIFDGGITEDYPTGRIISIDSVNYVVIPTKETGDIDSADYNNMVVIPHNLGYVPAWQLSQTPASKTYYNIKINPISATLGELDYLLFTLVSKDYLGSYMWPIIGKYKEGCDFRDPKTGNKCESGYVYNHDDTVLSQNGVQGGYECPKCKESKLIGAGTVVEFEPIVNDSQTDMSKAINFFTPSVEFLKFTNEDIDRKQKEILYNTAGLVVVDPSEQSKNRDQVNSQYEKRKSILSALSADWSYMIESILSTMAKFRYGDEFISIQYNLGTEFFIKTVEDLERELATARENGASISELQALKKQIIQTRHRNNPSLMNRLLMLLELEEYSVLSVDDLLKLREKGLITERNFERKINFDKFVKRFEREEGKLEQFLPDLDLNQRVDIINQFFDSYLSEGELTAAAE